ncbi:MAG: XdhC family protein [Myxococcales bacterium]|nr:XdhC family protein [Myxococcales bacterium]MCB9705941.1 XdhC family protein [Myxococcales bacterium]
MTEAIARVLRGQRPGPAALATVIGRAGSAPQAIGARLLLCADGTLIGTVGGGAIEAQVLDACRQTLVDGQTRRVEAHLVRDLGMCCGGSMEVFVEHLQAAERLILIGAGHVAQAIAPLALGVGFRVVVVDDRDELLGHPAFEGAERLAYDVDELADGLGVGEASDHLVILTRDHQRDQVALAALLRRPHRYLGMIGSRRKVHTVLARVLRRERELGRPAPDLARVRAPIGLALGGRTPAEIAVSVIAELIALRHGGSGASMSVVDEAAARLAEDPGA